MAAVHTCCAMYRAALGPLPSPKLMSAVTLLVVSSFMMGMRAVRMMISFLMGILRYLHVQQQHSTVQYSARQLHNRIQSLGCKSSRTLERCPIRIHPCISGQLLGLTHQLTYLTAARWDTPT